METEDAYAEPVPRDPEFRYFEERIREISDRVYRFRAEDDERRKHALQLFIVALYCFLLGRISMSKKN